MTKITTKVELEITDDTVIIDQEALFADGTLNEFDSTTPAWDKEVTLVSDFDSVVDADGDLISTGGFVQVRFDDANLAYGVMNADTVDQTSGVLSFWFAKSNVAIQAGAFINLAYVMDGGAGVNWIIRLQSTGIISAYTLDDGAGYSEVSTSALSGGWHKISIHFAVST